MHEAVKDLLSIYKTSERQVMETLVAHAKIDLYIQRDAVATAILSIEKSRKETLDFSLRQVFQHYPLHTAEGQTLFELLSQLPAIESKSAQQAYILSCFEAAYWLDTPEKRAAFFDKTASWGLSMTARLFAATSHLTGKKMAKRLASAFYQSAIAQAMQRLIEPLFIEHTPTDEILTQHTGQVILRPGLPIPLSPEQGYANQKKYLELLEVFDTWHHSTESDNPAQLSIQLHHFILPFDPRNTRKNTFLTDICLPIVESAGSKKIKIIFSGQNLYGLANETQLVLDLIQRHNIDSRWIGLEISAADPASFACVQALSHQLPDDALLILRITKEKRKPCLNHSKDIHTAYFALSQYIMDKKQQFFPLFVTHNSYTVARIYHTAKVLQYDHYEIHFRYGLGDFSIKGLSQSIENLPLRVEIPIGLAHTHQDYFFHRIQEIANPQSFLNQLINPDITTAALVEDPRLKPRTQSWQETQGYLPWMSSDQSGSKPLDLKESTHNTLARPQTLESLEVYFSTKQPVSLWTESTPRQRYEILKLCFDLNHAPTNHFGSQLLQRLIEESHMCRRLGEIIIEKSFSQALETLEAFKQDGNATREVFSQWFIISDIPQPLSPLLAQMVSLLYRGQSIMLADCANDQSICWSIQEHLISMGVPEAVFALAPSHPEIIENFLSSNAQLTHVIFNTGQQLYKKLHAAILKNPKQPLIQTTHIPLANTAYPAEIILLDETTPRLTLAEVCATPLGHWPRIILCPKPLIEPLLKGIQQGNQGFLGGDQGHLESHLITFESTENLETERETERETKSKAERDQVQTYLSIEDIVHQINNPELGVIVHRISTSTLQSPGIFCIEYPENTQNYCIEQLVRLGCCHQVIHLSLLSNWKRQLQTKMFANQFYDTFEAWRTEPMT